MKRTKASHGDAGDHNPNDLTLVLGTGSTIQVPTIERREHENGRGITYRVPDLEGYAPCPRCGGDLTRDGSTVAVLGGWLPHFRFEGGSWYTSSRPCPECVWGAYRKLAATRSPFHAQFQGCSSRDLGMLGLHLRAGVVTFRQAVEQLRGYTDLHARLAAGLEAMERGTGRAGAGWSEANAERPMQPSGVGF